MSSTKPLAVIPRSLLRMVNGKAQYKPESVNKTVTLEDGRTYRIFREVIMRDNPPQPTGGVFRVWFYTTAPIHKTMNLSKITKMFFFGMPGFRGKMWMVNEETQEFGGIYQFNTVEDAKGYAESFAMGLSKRRSRPGMFTIDYYPKVGEQSLYIAQQNPVVIPTQPDDLSVSAAHRH